MRENIHNIYHRSLILKELKKGPKTWQKDGEKTNKQFTRMRLKWSSNIWKHVPNAQLEKCKQKQHWDIIFTYQTGKKLYKIHSVDVAVRQQTPWY